MHAAARRGARSTSAGSVAVGRLALRVAFAVWNTAKTGSALCFPHSLYQGHGVWHLLCAVSAYCLFRLYVSEEPADVPALREPSTPLRARTHVSPTEHVRTDAQVIAASLHDPEEFAHVYDRHAAAIHRYLLRRLGAEVAEDLTADTFTAAFRSRSRFDASQATGALPWLYGIASNLSARHRRHEVRGLRALARTGIDPVAHSWVEEADQRILARASNQQLAQALAELSAGDRDVLLLVAWADLTYAEVAQALAPSSGDRPFSAQSRPPQGPGCNARAGAGRPARRQHPAVHVDRPGVPP